MLYPFYYPYVQKIYILILNIAFLKEMKTMHKIKKKLTIQSVLLAFGIAFLSSFCLMSAYDKIVAYGADGNGEDIRHPGDLKNHNGEGYPSSSKTGWLIYLYKYTDGSTPYTPILVPTGNLSGNAQLKTVFGVGCGGKKSNSFGIDPPWTSNQSPNGSKVKNNLITEGSSYHWAKVVENLWGKSVVDKVNEEPEKYYLVLEVVMCHAITPGKGGGSGVTTATVHNWAQIDMANGKPPRGDGKTGWCDNAVAPDSAYLDRDWLKPLGFIFLPQNTYGHIENRKSMAVYDGGNVDVCRYVVSHIGRQIEIANA